MEKKSKQFNSKIGFVLAAAGSAIGMGNIWMFPYRVGQFGGAAFLLIYFVFIALFAVSGMSSEFALGRFFQTDPVTCYQNALKKRNKRGGAAIGWLTLTANVGVAVGYAVIVGWSLRYIFGAASGAMTSAPDSGAYFGEILGAFGSYPWHIAVVVITGLVIVLGINKGIEFISKLIMPAFFIIFVGLAIYVATLPNAGEGYRYLFIPKWEALLDPMTWIMAMGQAFFSLSITGSTLVIYGSYLKKEVNIVKTAVTTAVLDTLAALISAFVIIPAVFSFGIDPAAGPKLMFVILPKIFSQMKGGSVLAVFFFVSVFFAGLTSLISMFEVLGGTLISRIKIKRTIATLIVCALVLGIGIFIETEELVGKWMDFVTIYWMPLGALAGGIIVFFVMPKEGVLSEYNLGRQKPMAKWFYPVSRYVYVPIALLVVVLGFVFKGI